MVIVEISGDGLQGGAARAASLVMT